MTPEEIAAFKASIPQTIYKDVDFGPAGPMNLAQQQAAFAPIAGTLLPLAVLGAALYWFATHD